MSRQTDTCGRRGHRRRSARRPSSPCAAPATEDVAATVAQILRLEQAGCQIIRVAVPDHGRRRGPSAPSTRRIHIPLVADIHFDYRLALRVRPPRAWTKSASTPATSALQERVRAVADDLPGARASPSASASTAARWSGQLLAKVRRRHRRRPWWTAPWATCRLLNDCDFDDICLSVKCSHVPGEHGGLPACCPSRRDYPLHLGVTEAGTPRMGVLKSAIGIGGLLCQGIGDTIRVSLTADPVEEVRAAQDILPAAGHAEDRARPDLLPHLRPHPVRHDPHCPGGGAAASRAAPNPSPWR